MKIGELAKRLGVAPSKIRFLEANGLVQPPDRRQSGYRDYDESAVERLEIILQAQSSGSRLTRSAALLPKPKEATSAATT